MKQFSDDEQGFIPAQTEVKQKQATRIIQAKQTTQKSNNFSRVQFRFSDGFIKKEPEEVFATPLTLYTEPLTTNAQLDRKPRYRTNFQSPYREYCSNQSYKLCYCRHSGDPLLQERIYMKNQVSLLSIQDKNSASLKQLKPFQIEESSFNEDSLEFDSRFQSGNLYCAFRRKGTNEYHLFISNDTNTLGYNQWFYFSIRNAKRGMKYIFRIVNYKKMLDFYRNGQRIAYFSLKQSHKSNSGWSWNGNNINFEESTIRNYPEVKMYSLRFQIQPKHQNDYIMLASTIPYSYSRLLYDLKILQKETKKLDYVNFNFKSICTSLCNNDVPEVSITGSNTQKKDKDKKIIIFLARQHPGEVWSSFMILGIMRAFIKPTPQIKYILQNCVVKIYPMINVDGVIYGNFRCDVTGVDLNRRWKEPSKIFHPQIFQIKRKIQNYSKKAKIQICFDLHGHSKKYNIFCYSCKINSYTCRILPYLISSQNSVFSIPSCTFGLTRDKQTTARGTISRIMHSQNVLTIQTSSFGERVNLQGRQFHPIDIFRMSQSILIGIRFFIDKKSPKFQQSEKAIKQSYQQFIKYDKQNEQQSGSDSQPELDEIDFKIKISTIIDKKYTHQFKSFVRDNFNAQLHLSQLTFNQQKTDFINEVPKFQSLNQNDNNQQNFKKSEVFVLQKGLEVSSRMQYRKNLSKLKPGKLIDLQSSQKKSTIANRSQFDRISRTDNPSKISAPKITLKNILVRDKKRQSYAHDLSEKKQIITISVAHQDFNRSKQFRDIKRQEQDRKSIQQFVNKYEKFIPNSFSHKTKGRLDVLQEGLDHDDGQFQLNVMLQNKRRIQLQKLKQRIEQSTEIAERQGKVKWNTKKQPPIIDYKKFKRNQRLRQQVKRLGELSERYLDGHRQMKN